MAVRMASITLVVFTYQGHVRRYCSEPPIAFPWTEVSKAGTVGQAVPEIPLSVGSKTTVDGTYNGDPGN